MIAVVRAKPVRDASQPRHHPSGQHPHRPDRASFLESGTQSPADDAEAIELALQYLVSSVPDPGRGQGLTITVEQATALAGKVVLRSGGAQVTVDPRGSRIERVEPIGATVVGISLPLYPGRR